MYMYMYCVSYAVDLAEVQDVEENVDWSGTTFTVFLTFPISG